MMTPKEALKKLVAIEGTLFAEGRQELCGELNEAINVFDLEVARAGAKSDSSNVLCESASSQQTIQNATLVELFNEHLGRYKELSEYPDPYIAKDAKKKYGAIRALQIDARNNALM